VFGGGSKVVPKNDIVLFGQPAPVMASLSAELLLAGLHALHTH